MNASSHQVREKAFRFLESGFAVIGAVICLVVVASFTAQPQSAMWLLPGLYFIEIVVLAILGAASRIVISLRNVAAWRVIPWIVTGVLFAFVILGAMTIGIFLFPAMLAFLLSGIFADSPQIGKASGHFGLAVLSALIQGGLMVLLINLPLPYF
jgi:hypothetical protein